MSKWIRLMGAPAAAAVLAFAVGCGGDSGAADTPAEPAPEAKAEEPAPAAEEPAPAAEEKKEEPVAADTASDNAMGKELFTTYCVSCHGAEGKGDGVAGAALNPKPASFADAGFWTGKSSAGHERTDEHLATVIKGGGAAIGLSPLMAPWGAVIDTDEKLNAIVAYVKSFKPAE